MNKELADIQDLKGAFISHCKALGCEDNYIKVCENKFNRIEAIITTQKKMVESLQSSKEHLIDDLEGVLASNEVLLKENAFYKKLLKDYRHVSEKKILELKANIKALEIIKKIPFELEYDEDTDDWHLYIIITTQDGKYRETAAFGEGKEEYDLLKEILL